MITAHLGCSAPVDTLRWSTGDRRLCACEHCWSHEPFWQYVQVVANHAARTSSGAGNAGLAHGIWDALTRPRWRRLAWRGATPGVRWAVEALLEAAAREGWNAAQLYEVALRGVALHWKQEAREAPAAGRAH